MFGFLRRLATPWALAREQVLDRPSLLGLDVPYLPAVQSDPLDDQALQARLSAMTLMQREIYLLRIVDEMSVARIAHRLGLSRRSVRRTLRQAISIIAEPEWHGLGRHEIGH